MNKVLKIITKQEFTSLYRFGFLPKDPSRIIVEDERSNAFDNLFVERLLQLPYFSGDEEYLTIGFTDSKKNENVINIEEVIEIIPFTEAAKVSYEQKFDSRIVFQSARFEDLVTEAEIKIDVEGKIRGAESLWKILNIDQQIEHYVQKEDVDFALRAKRQGQKSNEFQYSFDAHLLAYDRYELFPNSDLGYFYDVGEVFAHSMDKPTFKGSGFYHFLESIKEVHRDTALSKLIDFIEKSEEVSAFKNKCSKGNLKQYLAGVLFLMFKDELADKDSVHETEIKKKVDYILTNKPYKEELRYALYLTGIFYGYGKFYTDLYNHEGLPIFGEKFTSKKDLDGKIYTQIDTETKEESVKADVELDKVQSDDETDPKDEEEFLVSEEIKNTSNTQMGIQEIRGQLTQILENESDKTKKLEGDFLVHLKNILSIFTETDDPNRDECIKVLKEEFSDVVDFKSKIVIRLKQNPELKFK